MLLNLQVTVSDGTVHFWGNVQTDCGRAARLVAERETGVRGVIERYAE